MSWVDEGGLTCLYERDVYNPDGLHMERGRPAAGREWSVWVCKTDEGLLEFTFNQESMSVDTARELRDALAEAISVAEAQA